MPTHPLLSSAMTPFSNTRRLQGQNAQSGAGGSGHRITDIIHKYVLMILTEQKVYEAEDVFFSKCSCATYNLINFTLAS